jgi:hypothetical protein
MGYSVDVAIDLLDTGGFTSLTSRIVEKAEENNCISHYKMYELDGTGRRTTRHHQVLSFEFPSEKEHVIRFLRQVREMRYVFTESVVFEGVKVQLLYASRHYLTMMNKYQAADHNKAKASIIAGPHGSVVKAVRC